MRLSFGMDRKQSWNLKCKVVHLGALLFVQNRLQSTKLKEIACNSQIKTEQLVVAAPLSGGILFDIWDNCA